MLLAFFEGIITALGALVLELTLLTIFNLPPAESAFSTLFIFVAVEEILKYAIITNHYLKSKNGEKIIQSALFIGLGFALTELFLKQLDYRSASLFLVSGVIVVHFFTAGIIGFFIARKYRPRKWAVLLLISLNILLHFGYNFYILRYF